MAKMEPLQEDVAHFSSFDLMQKKVIEAIFNCYEYYCTMDDKESDFTHQTKFFRSIRMVYVMVYRYMGKEMRQKIRQAFDTIETKEKEIDKSTASEQNKRLNKRIIEDETGSQILQLCFLALEYSPMNTELKEVVMNPNTIDLSGFTKKIRSETPIGIFNEDVSDGLQ